MLSRHRFDVDQYHRMIREGILTEDDRVELIDGEIVEMTPIGSRHAACVDALTYVFVSALGRAARVRIQNPVTLGGYSEPEPDVVLARPREDDYARSHPTTEEVLLLIEVADRSLLFDRQAKLPLCATAGVREVWIVDLTADALEVFRQPDEGRYEVAERLTRGTVSPLAFPDLDIEIAAILPATSDERTGQAD